MYGSIFFNVFEWFRVYVFCGVRLFVCYFGWVEFFVIVRVILEYYLVGVFVLVWDFREGIF